MSSGIRLFFFLLAGFAGTGPAAANGTDGAINGAWCSPDGKRITIDGTTVTTPGGNTVTGEDRGRAFRFVLPDGEFDAGTEIWLELEDSGNLRVSRLKDTTLGPPPHDEWTRCDPVS